MIALVVAELRRLASRRMTWVAALLLLLGVGLFQIAVNAQVAPPTASEVAQNQRYYEESRQDWEQNHVRYEQDCRDQGGSEEDCAYPQPTQADYGLAATPFADVAESAVLLSSFLALFASYLVSSSSIGAEYTSGAIANWLTFVPQRLKVFGSKLVAVVLTSAVIGAAVNFVMIGLVALLTSVYGGALTGAGGIAATAGRGVVLAVVAGVVGFGVALVTRHTVAALGLVLAYLVVATVLRPLAGQVRSLQWLPPWMPDHNLLAFLQRGETYYLQVATTTIEGTSYQDVERSITFGHSAVYWLVLVLVVTVGSALVFRRRDVT